MDNSRSPHSEPYWNEESFRSTEFPEASSTMSDAGIGGEGGGRAAHSDEEIILASNRPKKRAGRKKFKETRHPVYRGVRRRNNNRWVCELREPQKKSRIWLGTYPTAEMAARAHDVAAIALKGPSACLNFADSVWRLPVPASKDAKDIRRAAAEAAESFEAPAEVLKRLKVFDGGSGRNGTTEAAKDVKEVMPKVSRSVCGYADEKAIFDMEGLIESIAEGPLLSPSPCLNLGFCWEGAESTSDDVEISLWTY